MQPTHIPFDSGAAFSGGPAEVRRWMLEAGGTPAVAFDLGGVLLEGGVLSAAGEDEAFATLERQFGIPAESGRRIWDSLQDGSERGLVPESKVYRELAAAGAGPDPGAIRRALLDMVRPITDAVSVLEELHGGGFRTALATNHLRSWIDEWRSRFSWFEYIDVLIVSAEVGARKPSPEFFAQLRRKIGVPAAWFIDDRLQNVRSAQEWGFRGIWVSTDGRWCPQGSD